jgi:mannosyltransferase OCH1-like enzyme
MMIFKQTKSDLIRLALLYKHGGVYLDASTVAL